MGSYRAFVALVLAGCLELPAAPASVEDPAPGEGSAGTDAGLTGACEGASEALELDGRCYLRFDLTETWHDAVDLCALAGGALVTFDSEDEADAIAGLIGDRMLWIGLSDLAAENVFTWVSGERPRFTRWASGQPDDGDGSDPEDCVLVLGTSGLWDDERCWRDRGFVCER
jgi:hypothetical protein